MAITGEPDGCPMKLGVAITDIVTGMNGVQAILAALFARERTGRGQHIDLSLFESAVALLANVATGHLNTGRDPGRFGNAHATVVPYQLFDAADGTVALACGNDGQFRRLCEDVFGRPDLAADPRYLLNRDRVDNRETLIPELQRLFATRPTNEWLAELDAKGVPAGKVRSVAEVFTSPEVQIRGLVRGSDERHGTVRLVRSPLRFSDTEVMTPTAPPRLGEHTEEILATVRPRKSH